MYTNEMFIDVLCRSPSPPAHEACALPLRVLRRPRAACPDGGGPGDRAALVLPRGAACAGDGAEGIGVGWSTSVPNYNIREVIKNLRHLLRKAG